MEIQVVELMKEIEKECPGLDKGEVITLVKVEALLRMSKGIFDLAKNPLRLGFDNELQIGGRIGLEY